MQAVGRTNRTVKHVVFVILPYSDRENIRVLGDALVTRCGSAEYSRTPTEIEPPGGVSSRCSGHLRVEFHF